jgi:hypothetical protein
MRRGKRGEEDREVVSGRAIDFLGYQFFKEKTLMRKSTKQRFARKMKSLESEKRRAEVKASYWGWAVHADCRNLWNKITNGDMGFLKKGIQQRAQTKDGKKFFDVDIVRLMDIVNVVITVVDFESGVPTSQGDDRYCVLIEVGGKRKKFITNSFCIKDVLDQARERERNGEKIFPVEDVVIRRKSLGNSATSYYFDEVDN